MGLATAFNHICTVP